MVCRICLQNLAPKNTYFPIDDFAQTAHGGNVLIRSMIEKCVPEMDLDVSENIIICAPCYNQLLNTYNFRSRCFQTEEKIYSFLEKNNLELGSKIDLSKLNVDCEMTRVKPDYDNFIGKTENIIEITDSDSDSESNPAVESTDSNSNSDCRWKIVKIAQTCQAKATTEIKTYKCKYCNDTFTKKRYLKKHKWSHKPYVCEICKKGGLP